MATKVYRVISRKGRRTRVVFVTPPFDSADWDADYNAFIIARREFNQYTLKLYLSGETENVDIERGDL